MGWLAAAIAGLLTGVLSGLGIGGGTLLLLYMTVLGGMEQTAAQGINLLYFLPAAATALPSHFKNGFVDKTVALPAILAGLVTTGMAAWVATGLDTALLRRCFGGFLIYVGLTELFRKKDR